MVKCRKCGESIVIYCADNGSIHILGKVVRGFIDQHYCGSYEEMFSEYMLKKLGIE